MKLCPTCDRQFDDEAAACPDDGTRLVRIQGAAERADAALLGRTIDDRYAIEARLGSGGMGTVFSATQTTVGRRVAIKVLPADVARDTPTVRRFMQEARAASALTHPNVITLHDFGQTEDGLLYLVMELVEGETLGHALRRDGAMSADRAVRVAAQILNALEEAHAAGIIHRDLKPDNVILSPRSGNPDFLKVLDFGLAKIATDEGTLTRTGQVFGTPGYMSPEQARGETCDGRADLYAVGVMLYEMLAGQRPFAGDTTLAVLVKHIHEAPPPFEALAPPVRVPAALSAVVFRALAKRRDDRYATAAEMNRALQAALDVIGASPPPTVRAMAAPPAASLPPTHGEVVPVASTPRRRGLFAAAGLAAATGAALIVWQTMPRANPTPAAAPPVDAAVVALVPDAAPRTVDLALQSQPPGAAVEVTLTVDGQAQQRQVPATPATLTVPRGAHVRARFRLDGRTPATVDLQADESRAVLATLEPEPPTPPAPATAPVAAARPPQHVAPRPAAPATQSPIDDLK